MSKRLTATVFLALTGCTTQPTITPRPIDPAIEKRSICQTSLPGGEQARMLQAFGREHGIENINCDISNEKFSEALAAACAKEPSPERTAELQRIRIAFEVNILACDGEDGVYRWEQRGPQQ
jgi:hypothetical protein